MTARHPNRTLLEVSGTVAAVEAALHVKLQVYRHPTEARTFFAPDSEPSLELAVPVLAIDGLDNFALPHPMELRVTPLDQLPDAGPYATGSGPRGYFIGSDFRAAYAPGVSLDGAGQTVGLVSFDGFFPSDVLAYEKLAGLPNVTVTNVLVSGVSGVAGANNREVALDIDMVISMAPGLAKVIVYEGASLFTSTLLNRIATDNLAKQISCSWAFVKVVDAARDQAFQQFAAQGQSMFQASRRLRRMGPGAATPKR